MNDADVDAIVKQQREGLLAHIDQQAARIERLEKVVATARIFYRAYDPTEIIDARRALLASLAALDATQETEA